MSLNDVAAVRRIFKGFLIRELNMRYSATPKKTREAHELLIANYPLVGGNHETEERKDGSEVVQGSLF